MDQRTKQALWIAAGVVFVAALVVHHNITTTEIIIFCVMVPSIILHEVTHGWVANAFGDDTAKRAGRLSLNPAVHVDPVGTLIVPALLSIGGVGFFGWAKPVPVNVGRLRSPRNQGVVVSLAGPAMNAVLAATVRARLRARRPAEPLSRRDTVGRRRGGLLCQPRQRRPLCVQPDPRAAARRLRPLRAAPARRAYWPTYLRYRQYTMPILLGLVMLNFFLYPHGPLTWLFDHLYNWWAGVLGLYLTSALRAAAPRRPRPARTSPPRPRVRAPRPAPSTPWT